jgi:hypothetical protein
MVTQSSVVMIATITNQFTDLIMNDLFCLAYLKDGDNAFTLVQGFLPFDVIYAGKEYWESRFGHDLSVLSKNDYLAGPVLG